MPRVFLPGRRHIVYVDAKLTGIHEPSLRRKAFVGYIVEGREDLTGFQEVRATETDEAEERAILFAVTDMRNRLRKFTVICDHESAVLKVNGKGEERKKAKKDVVLPEIWRAIDENGSIEVKALGGNPAHTLLNRRLKELDPAMV
jgi:hypothetical protein